MAARAAGGAAAAAGLRVPVQHALRRARRLGADGARQYAAAAAATAAECTVAAPAAAAQHSTETPQPMQRWFVDPEPPVSAGGKLVEGVAQSWEMRPPVRGAQKGEDGGERLAPSALRATVALAGGYFHRRKGDTCNGMPVWVQRGATQRDDKRAIFSSSAGRWLLGLHANAAAGRDAGLMRSQPHGGTLWPHECSWQLWDAAVGQWVSDEDAVGVREVQHSADDLYSPRLLVDVGGLVAISKPPHLETVRSQDSDTWLDVLKLAKRLLRQTRVHPLHRLDKHCGGVLLLASGAQIAGLASALGKYFREGLIEKTYWVVVSGRPQPASGTVSAPIAHGPFRMSVGSDASAVCTTHYQTLATSADGRFSWLQVRPEQGRRHQVRAHLAYMGHPVCGDVRYGGAHDGLRGVRQGGWDHVLLHARSVRFAVDTESKRHGAVWRALAGALDKAQEQGGGQYWDWDGRQLHIWAPAASSMQRSLLEMGLVLP
eukprot:TRINITY_DN47816_c0_g1_i1.p1 TRINITY_DN47816_c0_g1~~TRINITY_DN47816_c0_g1_i1.p1  ORF type:complete len:487 (+),score=92.44 TRINITY_DN47816_c0_g1_i1:82-1542(+)